MAVKFLDARGMKHPLPQLKMLDESRSMANGDILEVIADSPTFENDVKKWCSTMQKGLLYLKVEGNSKRCQVRI
jgi:tRNA 2-thiouridine synthesizing protein A